MGFLKNGDDCLVSLGGNCDKGGISDVDTPHGIIVFGVNGSGKTTLAHELARILSYKHIDIEDYAFEEAEVPYSKPRPRDECISLMLADVEKHSKFVFSTCVGDWGDIIPQFYRLAVLVSVPYELRMERVKKRTYDKYGGRICAGGDMYEQTLKFFDFIATRPLSRIEQWAETLTCPTIRIDGTEDWRTSATNIVKQFLKMEGSV